MTPADRHRWVLDLPVDSFEKSVLHTLACRADQTSLKCFTGMERLARDCGMSEAKARRVIRALESQRLIAVTIGGGAGRASEYSLLIESHNPVHGTELTRYSVPTSTKENPVQQNNKPGTDRKKTRYSVAPNRLEQDLNSTPAAPTIWTLADAVLGKGKRSLLGKLIAEYGEGEVASAIATTSAKGPADAVPFLLAVLRKKNQRASTDSKIRPAL